MTLALAMITNDAEATKKLITEYEEYFDKIYITVATVNKQPYNNLKQTSWLPKKVELTYFKWIDNFGKAREFNRKQIDTDYWFWMDDDDHIDNPEKLKDVVKFMNKNQLDVAYLKYDYFQNDAGEGVNDHWRERIIRTDSSLTWADVPVHETLTAPYARSQRFSDVTILHHKTMEAIEKSHERNYKLLKKHWEKTQDPRSAFYLGLEHMAKEEYEQAIEMFRFLVQHGGWNEEKYDALLKIADCFTLLEDDNAALKTISMAIELDPEKPDAYWQKVFVYGKHEKYDKAIRFAKDAMNRDAPEGLRMLDPTLYKYRGLFMTAQCYLFAGRVKEAWQLYNETKQIAPYFIKEQSEQTNVPWDKLFEEAYLDLKAIDYTKWLLKYTKDFGGKPQKILDSLPFKTFQDSRLNAERAHIFPPKVWPKKSIVFFCGQSSEPWGPDTLSKGMGGSEEAIVYLSRELARLGWQVTVFNDREDEYVDYAGHIEVPTSSYGSTRNMTAKRIKELGTTVRMPASVIYKPWTLLNPYDEFDIFVSWRQPQNCVGVKARMLCVDCHDTLIGHVTVTPEQIKNIDLFFLKSQFQADNSATPIPKEKQVIVGNGIVSSQFKEDV